jgi:Ni,Fe-hydrogenase I cytochrome b subunit
LYDNHAKVGLGLWNSPAIAFVLEAALLFGGIWFYLRGRLGRSVWTIVLGVVMLGIQAYLFFGPPPSSDRAAASTAIVAYGLFALVIWWLQDRRAATIT